MSRCRSLQSAYVHHLLRHRVFYAALFLGTSAWLLTRHRWPSISIAIAGDAFYLTYLLSMGTILTRFPTDQFREWADDEDEGLIFISVMTIAAVIFSMTLIFSLLNTNPRPNAVSLSLSLISAPLAWTFLLIVAALHYAHIYYRTRLPMPDIENPGLRFPGKKKEPGAWDFLYFATVIGMTAQTSDTDITITRMRRLATLHGIVSFLFYSVLVAVAVNIVILLIQGAK
jgi:uncharacterized membrane protein